ncbi:hypothetical protein [Serratia fonticola]
MKCIKTIVINAAALFLSALISSPGVSQPLTLEVASSIEKRVEFSGANVSKIIGNTAFMDIAEVGSKLGADDLCALVELLTPFPAKRQLMIEGGATGEPDRTRNGTENNRVGTNENSNGIEHSWAEILFNLFVSGAVCFVFGFIWAGQQKRLRAIFKRLFR